MYGSGTVLDGSPIGGGPNSLGLYSTGRYVTNTWAGLKAALAQAKAGEVVYLADGSVVVLSANSQMYNASGGTGLWVPPGVTLAAGRGRPGVAPGRIEVASGFRPNDWAYLLGLGAGSRVCGLEIYGHQDTTSTGYTWSGISAGVDSELFNNEIHGFGYAGVTAFPDITNVHVHHNYIHHCQGAGHGYGVEVAAVNGTLSHDDDFHLASALVEGNIIDYTRHCIANQSGRGSYTFRHNLLKKNAAYESQCDVHGQNDDPPGSMAMAGGQYVYCAGEQVEIYNNTSECSSANEFVGVRGIPYASNRVKVHHNWLKIAGDPALIVQFMFRMTGWMYNAIDDQGRLATGSGYGPFVQMDSYDNWYGSSSPPDTPLRQLQVSVQMHVREV
jgi:hypothetical protein